MIPMQLSSFSSSLPMSFSTNWPAIRIAWLKNIIGNRKIQPLSVLENGSLHVGRNSMPISEYCFIWHFTMSLPLAIIGRLPMGFAQTYPLRNYISRNRFEPIDRFLYCTQPGQSFQSTFGRVIHISDYIKSHAQRYYKPGPNVAVDEVIQQFQGRA